MFVFIHDAYLNGTSNVLVSLLTIFLGRIWFRFFLINEDALDPLRNDILALMASLNSKNSHKLILFLLWNQITNLEISDYDFLEGMNLNMYEYVNS